MDDSIPMLIGGISYLRLSPEKIRQCKLGVMAAEQWPDQRGMSMLAQSEIAGVERHNELLAMRDDDASSSCRGLRH
jgi:hypothetical protein